MVSEISSAKRAEIKSKSVIGLPNTVTGKPDIVKNAIYDPIDIIVTEVNTIVGDTNDELTKCKNDITENGRLIEKNKTDIQTNKANIEKNKTEISKIIDKVYPVGAIYMSTVATSPEELFGGKWEPINNRFLYASGKYSAGASGGEETHVLSIAEMPAHNHDIYNSRNAPQKTQREYLDVMANWGYGGVESTASILNRGNNQPHNNMPPYLVVYMWKRTA